MKNGHFKQDMTHADKVYDRQCIRKSTFYAAQSQDMTHTLSTE